MRTPIGRLCGLLAVIAVVVPAGCSDSGDSPGGSGDEAATLRVIIADGNLRQLGDPCNGAGAFRSVHAEADFVIEDGDGVEVARGVLPGGTAEKMMDVSFREDMRQPTMCVMEVDVEGLSAAEGHDFIVGDGFTLPIEPSEDAEILGEVLVS